MATTRARALRPLVAAATLALGAGLASGVPGNAAVRAPRAEPQVILLGPTEPESLLTVTPTFTIRTEGFEGDLPRTVQLQLSRDSRFAGGFLVDTTIQGGSAVITLPRALPELERVYWRALAVSASGTIFASAVTGPRIVPQWVTLISPTPAVGSALQTRRPRFVWSSPDVSVPPGPWRYDLDVSLARSGQIVVSAAGIADTTFEPTIDLETNTPYRWAVRARLANGQSARTTSHATFVLVDETTPLSTLLYQNFPNPFPSVAAASTCIWFDLRQRSTVRLEIFDIRGNRVRTLVPADGVPAELSPGRYGRSTAAGSTDGIGTGCDGRFVWDGTSEDGRSVPAGVYLLRFQAGGQTSIRKILFRGR